MEVEPESVAELGEGRWILRVESRPHRRRASNTMIKLGNTLPKRREIAVGFETRLGPRYFAHIVGGIAIPFFDR